MKNFFSLAALLILFQTNSDATIRTVCNMPYSPGQFTSVSNALLAALPNDTIYVHGSTFNYGPLTVNKNGIVFIGAGHNPNKQAPLPSAFTSITILSGFTKCQFIGLTIETLSLNFGCNYTSVKRCKFTLQVSTNTSGIIYLGGGGLAHSLLVEGCIFSGMTGPGPDINFNNYVVDSTIIRNNIFQGFIGTSSFTTNPFTLLISNNIFLGIVNAFNFTQQAMINNNIFYRSSPQGTGPGCTMNNNISFLCPNPAFSAPGSNNLVNINPVFVNFPGPAFFSYTHDYRLAPGSPGLLNGTDGTDRGVFGGFGFKFNMTGEPAIAEITNFVITSPILIAPGGTLNITVTSKRIK